MTVNKHCARLNEILALAPVIPVITIDDAASAPALARALVAGGLRTIEITLRTKAAIDAAHAIIAEVPEAIVGTGTVLSPADYEMAAKLGATFAISPGQSPELLDAAASGRRSRRPPALGLRRSPPLMIGVRLAEELLGMTRAAQIDVKIATRHP